MRNTSVEPVTTVEQSTIRAVIAPYVVSRLFSDVLIAGMAAGAGHALVRQGFARWDGRWYTAIARSGYPSTIIRGHYSAWAFFPLLPAAMHVLGWFDLPLWLAGVLLSHAAFLVALLGLHRLLAPRFSPRATRLAVWTLALFPAALAFSMVYPSSIFLAASVWAFVFLDEHRDLAAGLCAAAATLARPNGFVLVVALAVAVGLDLDRLRRACGPAIVALGGWMLYNLAATGNPLTFFVVKRAWQEITLLSIVGPHTDTALIHLSLAATALALVFAARHRIPRSWSLLTVLYVVPSLALGIVGMGRYANECFPPFASAGHILSRRNVYVRGAAFTALVVGQVGFAYWVIGTGHIV
ncbi:MAG TPA: hypothetical protein VEP49_14850 [Acidimicrobiia bacterium]|nr:hypothetical protein [Acidimicrobiia bacterium]